MTASNSAASRSSGTLETANEALRDADPGAIIRWASHTFPGRLAVSSSFGAHSALMLHLVSVHAPDTPVIFVDTGHLFPETYRFARDLAERFDLDLRIYQPRLTAAHQEALYGRLWEQGEEGVAQYLRTNKVEPMVRALRDIDPLAWLSGVRADQTEHRRSLDVVTQKDGRTKVHPLLRWTLGQVEDAMREEGLPFHPLYEEGYRSVGDVHSTLPTLLGQDPREGRLLGKKRECGIHLALDAQSLTSSKL